MDEELLVAGSSLSLFSTHNAADHVWTKPLASPAKIVQWSYDTSLIATTGTYDRMVKIWRRLSLADQRFEYDYLPHPSVVTGLIWRRPFHRDQSFDNVLYTLCADNKLRIWSPGDLQSFSILQLWGEIDLMDSIQPRSLEDRSYRRFAFVIHSRDFTLATERAVQHASNEERDHLALLHLIEVANRSPEIFVVLDERGNMSAWGIESVGARYRMPGDIFNVAHVDGLKFRFNTACPALEGNVQFFPFCGEQETKPFSLLVHHFDGRIEWLEGKLDQFFDPSPRTDRLSLKASWTGHSSEIRKVVRSASGKAVISRTKGDESLVWIQKNSSKGTEIKRACILDTKEHIHRVWLLQDGRFVVFLHYDSISLWDARGSRAVEVARRPYSIQGKPLCLLHIPEEHETEDVCHIATISSEMKGVSWEIRLPPSGSSVDKIEATLEDFDQFDLGSGDNLSFVLSVDPAGRPPVISGFLDIFARDIAISYTNCGKLTSWTARPNQDRRKLEWLVTSSIDTGIEQPFLASGTSIRKAALVSSDQTQLTIWGTKNGILEHEEQFTNGQGVIQDLDWCSTPDNQSILAVGFPHQVIVYGQLRFDYLDSRPSWAALREINVLEYTPHNIGDSVWLGGGSFVVGAGNQLIVLDDKMSIPEANQPDLRVSARDKSGLDIFTVVRRLNGPLPLYHPQYVAQFILGGKILLVQRILLRLWNTLKFHSEGDPFDKMLEFSMEDISKADDAPVGVVRKNRRASYVDFVEGEPEAVTEEVASSLNELLTTREVPLLSSREQFHLADVVECIGTVEKHRRSIDENGCRFLLFFRQHSLRESQHAADEAAMSWREITWAFHSNSQDILADLVSRHYKGRMLWQHAKESGVFMWLTDLSALVWFLKEILGSS
jgi:WD40 repeat protein